MVRNKENKWGIKAVSGGKKKQITFFYKKCIHPMLQKRNYLKLECVLDFGQN